MTVVTVTKSPVIQSRLAEEVLSLRSKRKSPSALSMRPLRSVSKRPTISFAFLRRSFMLRSERPVIEFDMGHPPFAEAVNR
ncbi:hypothetical protein D3C86_1729810 [compost metagenome]